MDYSKTVNLPSTDFPMKADLPKREPELLKKWEQADLYRKIQNARKDSPTYILHDGPPYANGHIHLGHALNKTLKDFIIKHKSMQGYRTPYVPGWDCHGLPIELQVTKKLGEKAKQISKAELRQECRKHAGEFIGIQRDEFRRLGVFADYENPYLTMSADYEARIVEVFGELFKEKYIFKGKKPIFWCPTCETALAEAEVEYEDHTSDSIYVKFRVDPQSVIKDGIDKNNLYVVIWTTTPWTIPANLAVCFHPDFKYSAFNFEGEYYVIADSLADNLAAAIGKKYSESIPLSIEDIKALKVTHPFIDRESKVIFGRHVTLEQGTGVVHTAPGHGMEDYIVGLEHGLEIYCPVDHSGRYTEAFPLMQGEKVFAANPKVIALLEEKKALLQTAKISHSYPHCWRCKKPLIFRATEQWFLGIDIKNLRAKGLNAVDETEWIPSWGESRFRSMVEGRPDWCLSRQRSWGVPIPSFTCQKCGENAMSAESIDYFAQLSKTKGIDAWFTLDINELIPPGTICPKCGANHFEKEFDILDVWFDSGVSNMAVLDLRADHRWPADIYLEGSDQHRGWFQSSLWPSLALRGRAPYNTVLTHGFLLDENGKAMSKSQGNVIPPEKIINQYGADILRLWVSSEDYRNDVSISMEMMKQIADSYRKIRNTFKFIIGNLGDFNPADKIAYSELPDLDKWLLHKLYQLQHQTIEAYDKFEFHLVYRKLINFCAVDLSSIYFDMSKDILYTEPKGSFKRLASQTILHEIFESLARLIAPLIPFTAEEVWQFTGHTESIHLETYYKLDPTYNNSEIETRMNDIIELKKDLLKALEIKRQDKELSSSIEADAQIYIESESIRNSVKALGEEADRFFQVAKIEILDKKNVSMSDFEHSSILVKKSGGKKCVRCWKYSEALGSNSEHPDLCPRCTSAVKAMTQGE